MSIQDFFNQPATLKNRTGYDQYGKETQGTGTTVYCRFQNAVKTRLKPDGSVEEIDATAFFDQSITLNQGDHLVVAGIDFRVMFLNQVVDRGGNAHHYEVGLQKWAS